MRPAQGTAAPVSVENLTVPGANAGLPARLYWASSHPQKLDNLLVFFHGGGFVGGGLEEGDAFLQQLAARNRDTAILATQYTLAGSVAPFPAAVEDAHAVLLWAEAHKSALGWSGRRMIVAGVEAGANLATVTNLMAHDRRGPHLAGQILIMPMLDPGLSSASMRAASTVETARLVARYEKSYRAYLPQVVDRMHPYASPLQSSRLRHLAPVLIFSANGDPLRDEAEQYGAKLVASGIKTTVMRLNSAQLLGTDKGGEFSFGVPVLEAITAFLAGLLALA